MFDGIIKLLPSIYEVVRNQKGTQSRPEREESHN